MRPQPEPGTPAYEAQVNEIVDFVSVQGRPEVDLPDMLLLWILDMSYHRGAICEASKRLRRDLYHSKTNP